MGPHYDHQVGFFEPPATPDQRFVIMARARRARAEAMADIFGALYAGVKTAARGLAGLIRCAGRGAALMPPRSDSHDGRPARLTTGCR